MMGNHMGLQLADQGALDAPMQRLPDKRPALARGDTPALMQHCGVDAPTMGRMVALLRSLDPKPGTRFGTAAATRGAATPALGLHETTVRRICSALLIQTPQRVLPLRALFDRSRVDRPGQSALPGAAVAAQIAAEVPAHPLSDDQLVRTRATRGLTLSRRTLTNRRNRAGCPGTAQRKRP